MKKSKKSLCRAHRNQAKHKWTSSAPGFQTQIWRILILSKVTTLHMPRCLQSWMTLSFTCRRETSRHMITPTRKRWSVRKHYLSRAKRPWTRWLEKPLIMITWRQFQKRVRRMWTQRDMKPSKIKKKKKYNSIRSKHRRSPIALN